MKKVYEMTDLCCASCAAEIERDVRKIEGVSLCNVNFIMQKMTLEIAEGADAPHVVKAVTKAVRRVEPDCDLVEVKA
ncbi:MAG: heavy-metal-associated domain-containing protein [Clostridia bacterium]|nr:heavy-metal-associated domain-containing protein [Clostridia bacterium]